MAEVDTKGDAASYAAALQEERHDRDGAKVEVIHKGAQASCPPNVVRCGEALAPSYKLLAMALRAEEQSRKDRLGV